MAASADERARLRSSLIRLVGERGLKAVDLALLLERAGVDRDGFDRHYRDLDDCFHQTFAELGEEFTLRMAAAFSTETNWRQALRAVAYSMLEWLKEAPDRARFTFVESLNADEATQATRDQLFSWLFALIDVGRQELEDPDSLTPATATAVGGAIYIQIKSEIEADRIETLDQLAPKLIYSAVLPYVGREAAAEELRRLPPDASA